MIPHIQSAKAKTCSSIRFSMRGTNCSFLIKKVLANNKNVLFAKYG